ncbi:tubulin delta chain isoform X3 [Bombina bombina]|uniref:tubulin delta chain isoform X3 n=1 Tax=Bombina bombina TaxID=8345 RepID=UPI00235B022F|nr:tubulin delta chain isoform X3 [Bombina bombina]
MSVIAVQLGQCGNQIGYELFDVICSDLHSKNGTCSRRENKLYQEACKERFFNEDESGNLVARAVLVDMEPKVISHSLSMAARSGQWNYNHHSHFSQKQGSGNNWANGYCVHGPKHQDCVMDLVRKQVEECDRLGGFFTIMSMAGGTGSGMGTHVTQCLRDAYPNSLLLNHVIWPYGTGEVIVQNYNSILTLSHLYQSSDALLVHENDVIHKVCSQLMNIKQISFRDVNKVIAHQLGNVFQPTYTSEGASHYSRNTLGDLMECLVPHPEFKMLGLHNIPQMSENSLAYSTFNWQGLIKHLRQMLIANAKMEEGINWQVQPPSKPETEKFSLIKNLNFNTSVANLAILRGKDVHTASLEHMFISTQSLELRKRNSWRVSPF